MKKIFILLCCFVLHSILVFSQNNIIIDTTGVPDISNPMMVCGGNKTFSIQMSNVSTATVSNISVTYDLPVGIFYSDNSLIGSGVSEKNITADTNTPTFTIASLSSGNSISFSISAYAGCDVLSILGNADSLKAAISVSYTKNGSTFTEKYKSTSITVYEPNISLQVSNNSATANVGDTVKRLISIVNGGLGYLDHLEFYLLKGSDNSIINLNGGNYSMNGDTAFISLSAPDFMLFGDGDSLFEQNEVITINEIVQVTGCIYLQAYYAAYWGCTNAPCQEVNAYADISVNATTPSLTYTAFPSQSGCYDSGIPNVQQILIVNNGTGPATNINVEVYQARSVAYSTMNFLYSYIDDFSFTYQYGINGGQIKPVVDSTVNNVVYDCFLSKTPKAYVRIQIPYLEKDDSLYINWNVYSCCITLDSFYTSYNGDKELNGWNYEVNYQNQCETNTFFSEVMNGRLTSRMRMVDQTSDGPADLNEGDTATYTFSTATLVLLPGESNQWYLAFEFIIPECLEAVNSSVSFKDNMGWVWPADSVTNKDSLVTAYFGISGKPSQFKYIIDISTSIDITLNCDSCDYNSKKDVIMNTYYVPSPNCNCRSQLGTITTAITAHCEIACDSGGIWTHAYDIYRTSYGLPDNDNNGIPDSVGALNMDSINYRTVMYHDTLSAFFSATVLTTIDNPEWKYVYVESEFSEKDVVALDAVLTIYDYSAGQYYNCTTIPFSSQGDTLFIYYLSVDSLSACGCLGTNIPSGFVYGNADSVFLVARYVVVNNVINDIYTAYVENLFYASPAPYTGTATLKYSCDNYSGYYNITGFTMENYGPSEVIASACDTAVIDQIFRASVGPCCVNYAGGNIFPYEYRPWVYVNYVKMLLPPGYNFESASYTFHQTGGTNAKLTSVTNMLPDSIAADTVYFNIEKYYKEFGGSSFFISDDGFEGIMSCKIISSCSVTPNNIDTITWNNGYKAPNNYIAGYQPVNIYFDPYNLSSKNDNITSTVPDLNILPTLSIIQGTDLTASWNLGLSNSSIYSDATHVWVSFYSQSNTIHVQYLINTTYNDTIYPNGDIFQLGTIGMAGLLNFNAVCTYNTCNKDSIAVYAGWDCGGYPLSLSSTTCFSQQSMLYLEPQPSKIELEIIQSPTNIDLCDTATYTIKVSSIQLGALQNIVVTAEIPYGLYLYNNTSELLYPNSGTYTFISDPVYLGNNLYQWNIDANSPLLDSLGLHGISDTTINYFKLSFDATTNCDFVSGFVVEFTASAEYVCGQISTSKTHSSLPLEIKGAPVKQYASLNFNVDNATLCDTAIKCHVSIVNLGPLSDLSSHHYVFGLPVVYDYVAGSFNNILNSALVTGPAADTINNQVMLDWTLPSYIATGDSVVFEFFIKENTLFNCGTYPVDMFTAQKGNALCKSSGDSCSVYFLSASVSDSINKEAINLDVTAISVGVQNISALNDLLYINASVMNTAASNFSDSLFLSVYYDTDTNGIYSSGDYLLGYVSDFISIAYGAMFNYADTLSVKSGYSCSLIAVISTIEQGVSCPCLSDELAFAGTQAIIPVLTDTAMCSGVNTLIGIQANSNINYSWYPSFGLSDSSIAQPFVNLSNTTANTYSVNYVLTAINSLGGCKVSDTMTVDVYPLAEASVIASDSIICHADTISFTYAGSSSSSLTFNWDFGSGTIISGNNAGPYDILFPNGNTMVSLVVSSGICSGKDSIIISSGSIAGIFQSADTSACENVPVLLSAGNGYTSYSWSTGDTISSISVTIGGIYWVQINNNSCIAHDTISVNLLALPNKVFEQTDSVHICEDSAIIGPLPSIYSYVWSTGSVNDSVIVYNSGYYSVVISNGNCEISDSVYMDFSEKIAEPFEMNDTTICSNNAVQLSAPQGYQHYVWSSGDTTAVIEASVSGIYWVQINNGNCNYTDSIMISILALPYSGLQADTIHSCAEYLSLNILPGYSGIWSTGASGDSIVINSSGYYWVNINNGLCSNTDSVYVNFSGITSDPESSVSSMVICEGEPLDISTSYTGENYLWSNGESTHSIGITRAGTYWVEISNQHCKVSDTLFVEAISDVNFRMGNVFTPNGDGLNELFYTQLDNIDRFHISIWNRWGNMVFESDHKDYSWTGEVGGTKPEPGVYFWAISYNTLCNPLEQLSKSGFVELLYE